MKIGSSFGSYQVVEASELRLQLRPDYKLGVSVLVAGIVFLLIDILMFSGQGRRHLLWWAPNWFKGAMIILPPIGILWFFVMTGRSLLIDVPLGVARRTKYFFLEDSVGLAQVTRVQLELDSDSVVPSGQYVKLNLTAADGRKLFEFANEKASEDEYDSLPTTDFAMMLEIAKHISGMLKVPVDIKGEPTKMSEANRKMLRDAAGA